ncbi:hypothetical protein OG462_03615 [Streptomyces sp. NBC_01077]|uniref:hypothetical protein n=1 Tax=Streptomyces sp. NBC_01077 TaxID=2903746 RepID=UPI00386D5430|nr:hypothetical protein OG462_03615 [Streptomyces sp. NBC_01077]
MVLLPGQGLLRVGATNEARRPQATYPPQDWDAYYAKERRSLSARGATFPSGGEVDGRVGRLLSAGGLLLSLVVAESWFWLALAGFVLMAAIYAMKGVRLLRARRPTA